MKIFPYPVVNKRVKEQTEAVETQRWTYETSSFVESWSQVYCFCDEMMVHTSYKLYSIM